MDLFKFKEKYGKELHVQIFRVNMVAKLFLLVVRHYFTWCGLVIILCTLGQTTVILISFLIFNRKLGLTFHLN